MKLRNFPSRIGNQLESRVQELVSIHPTLHCLLSDDLRHAIMDKTGKHPESIWTKAMESHSIWETAWYRIRRNGLLDENFEGALTRRVFFNPNFKCFERPFIDKVIKWNGSEEISAEVSNMSIQTLRLTFVPMHDQTPCSFKHSG